MFAPLERPPLRRVRPRTSRSRWTPLVALVCAALPGCAGSAALGAVAEATPPRAPRTDRELLVAEYSERLRGLWLGQVIANWTGLRSEGLRQAPPFFTDADWGQDFGKGVLDFVVDQDPWLADDDTDIEYVYVHLLDQHATHRLSAQQIADGWKAHVNHHIWVSDKRARKLIGLGVLPPVTGMGVANDQGLMIDAQLTTEVFGALAPGLPELAIENADLAIRNVSHGYATHAAQYFVALYSLAAVHEPSANLASDLVELVRAAKRFLPGSSKSAEIVEFVLAEYLANPDVDDWESTRDAIWLRYQKQAPLHGYKYQHWWESSVNFATGIMCLLYGEGDYRRTVRIGTLSGWDSDNPTATMGGLIGLWRGAQAVEAAFPHSTLSDRYWVSNTRDALPDHLPGDPLAEDTFTLLARRMVDIVTRSVLAAGGSYEPQKGRWLLPQVDAEHTPDVATMRLVERSANLRVRERGGVVVGSSSVPGHGPGSPAPHDPSVIADGRESDFRGFETAGSFGSSYSSRSAAPPSGRVQGAAVHVEVVYDRVVPVRVIRLIEGDDAADGGWFVAPEPRVLVPGAGWIEPPQWTLATAPDPTRPYQMLDFELPATLQVRGVRVVGVPGGSGRFVTVAELDALR